MYKRYFRRFLESQPERLHFAGHSHHYWPDVTRDAQLAYWDDSARHADGKWRHIFGEVMPRAREHIARILGTGAPEQIAFAPNTHEFVTRLISCFEGAERVRILSTDSEFHSFRRQSSRLVEAGLAALELVPSQPIEDFPARFIRAAERDEYDMIYVSQVFFNSGLTVEDPLDLLASLPSAPMLVVDGYHAFCALPTDIRPLAGRIFYLAGGYKYAQAGEGACFMHVPVGSRARPVNTGWFADFASLESASSTTVGYAQDGMRFAGATMDISGIYRFNAVMDLWQREGIEVADIHAHVSDVQHHFLARMDERDHPLLHRSRLIFREGAEHGHFLTFVLPSLEVTAGFAAELARRQVQVDHRGDRLRLGFGMYLDREDVDELFQRLPEFSDEPGASRP